VDLYSALRAKVHIECAELRI